MNRSHAMQFQSIKQFGAQFQREAMCIFSNFDSLIPVRTEYFLRLASDGFKGVL